MATTASAFVGSTTESRYTKVAIWLHWLTGFAVIANIGLAMLTEGMPRDMHRAAMSVHRPLGIAILALTLIRSVWRLLHKPPPLPAGIAAWQILPTSFVHLLFYALLLLLPLSGWVWVSVAAGPSGLFGLFTLPSIV